MRFVIFGATGFVGRCLISDLMNHGHEVCAVVRAADHGLTCRTKRGDPLDRAFAAEVIREIRADVIVNLLAAGVDPRDRGRDGLIAANASFPAALAATALELGVPVLLHVGSSAEYASIAVETPIAEQSPLEAERLYGASKAAGSLLVRAATNETVTRCAVMRAFNIFGPGEKPHRLFPSVVHRLAMGQQVDLSAGTQVRDFIHVGEACAALRLMAVALATGMASPGIYNLASGRGTSVAQFVRLIAQVMKADTELLRFGVLPMRTDDLPHVVGSTTRLFAAIGQDWLAPLDVSVRKGISELEGTPS